MAISGILPAFWAGKEFFSKIGLGHVLSTANAHLYGKKSEKTNDEKSRKCPKTGFPGIFGQKKSFYKIGLRRILDIAILRLCAKFHEKI